MTPDDASKTPEQKIALLKEQLAELSPAMESQAKAVQGLESLVKFYEKDRAGKWVCVTEPQNKRRCGAS